MGTTAGWSAVEYRKSLVGIGMHDKTEILCSLQDCRRAWVEREQASLRANEIIEDFLDYVAVSLGVAKPEDIGDDADDGEDN